MAALKKEKKKDDDDLDRFILSVTREKPGQPISVCGGIFSRGTFTERFSKNSGPDIRL